MSTVGTLSVAVRADASGMSKGFVEAQRQMEKFARQSLGGTQTLASSMTRMSSVLQDVARDFAITGSVGTREIKQLAGSGAQLLAVFGPAGMIAAGIATTVMSIVGMHNRAREEMERTRQKHIEELKKMQDAGDISGLLSRGRELQFGKPSAGVSEFAPGAFRGSIADFEARISALTNRMQELIWQGVNPGSKQMIKLGDRINQLKAQLAPLNAEMTQLQRAAENIREQPPGSALDAITISAQSGKAALKALNDEMERLARLREAGRGIREAADSEWAARNATAQAAQAAGVIELNRITGVTAALAPKVEPAGGMALGVFGDQLAIAAMEAKLFADALKTAAEKTAATQAAIVSGVRSGVGGALAGFGGIGTHLGALVQGGVSGLLGSLSGSLVTGIGKLFGFGRHKRATDESAEALQRLAQKARELNEALNNVPKGFKLAQVRGEADRGSLPRDPRIPRPPGGGSDRDDGGDGGGGGGGAGAGRGGSKGSSFVITGPITVVASNTRDLLRELERAAFEKSVRGGVSGAQLGFAPAG